MALKLIKGFSLIELLVVIAIISLLATIAFIYFGGARGQAGDAKRINDLNQIGRFLTFGCPIPDGGPGEYDLNELASEIKAKYPQYAKNIPNNFQDPKTGTKDKSNYKYILDSNNNCVLFANLENDETEIDLPALSEPTPRGGKGVFAAPAIGWNGTNKYFQISN